MKIIAIPNLGKYQHYKDRPHMPWIKWHKACLRDYKFVQLKDGERWTFIGLIILATENDNKIPFDVGFIAKKICFCSQGLHKKLQKLRKMKLIAIKSLSKCYQDATQEKRRVDKIREDKNEFLKNKSFPAD